MTETVLGNLLKDETLLQRMVVEGYIRTQTHPQYPYTIYNYTEKTQFDRVWNEATLQCRGLIVDDDGKIIARPFRKFFNWGEEQGTFSLETYRNSQVTVTDKLDGSLGILYAKPTCGCDEEHGDWAIATRGSFMSPQAIHASEKLKEYLPYWTPQPDTTYLFEIIYPENRIVCNYYDMDDIALLGTVNIPYGYSTGPEAVTDWPGPRAKTFGYRTFQEALEAQHRKGAEGLVVHFAQNDKRIKLKQPDYVELHRIVTGLNERRVWELMKSGRMYAEICEPLPEEFHPWVEQVYATIEKQWYDHWFAAQGEFDNLIGELPKGFSRKDFALKALKCQYTALLFLKLDGKDCGEKIWNLVRPEFTKGPWSRSEDNA